MERIKQALELARQEREKIAGDSSVVSRASTRGKTIPVENIEYQETKSVSTPSKFLRNKHIIVGQQSGSYVEAFRILRTQVLQRMRDNGWNVLAVTSPNNNAGKTLTAINLGISLAQELDYTVLMVDADLRHPKMHTYFNLHPEYGLNDYLTNDIPISNMLINPQDIPHFVMLPGGKALSNSSEMLSSPKMSQLVDELKSRYPSRIVIFDLPPLLSVSDAIAFSPYIDAALLVIENGQTKEDDIKNSLELLDATNVIGTVLNKANMAEEDKARIPGWFAIIKDLFKSGFNNRRLLGK